MTVLAFDCAVSGLGVALVRNGVCLAARAEGGRDQAARLLPAIETVLADAGVDRRAVALIAVTVGPGSFTGVRVGLAAARGLSVGLNVPLAGLTTTSVLLAQAVPAQAMPAERLTVAAVDSRLGDWFCAIGDGDTAPFVATASDLAARLAGRPCRVVGSGALALARELTSLAVDATAEEVVPDPVTLACLAGKDRSDTWRARNASQGLPRPLYLRGVNITLPDGARRTVD
jgi:tRNA threonylcarbamoyladenosine biosynthesis protein TsaB